VRSELLVITRHMTQQTNRAVPMDYPSKTRVRNAHGTECNCYCSRFSSLHRRSTSCIAPDYLWLL